MPKYDIITTNPENFERDRNKIKFSIQELKEKHKKTVQKWKPEDGIIYGILTVIGVITVITRGYRGEFLKGVLINIPHINFTKENIGYHFGLKSLLNHII